jgi:hypothetical protein
LSALLNKNSLAQALQVPSTLFPALPSGCFQLLGIGVAFALAFFLFPWWFAVIHLEPILQNSISAKTFIDNLFTLEWCGRKEIQFS